jgi:hypothetical protein
VQVAVGVSQNCATISVATDLSTRHKQLGRPIKRPSRFTPTASDHQRAFHQEAVDPLEAARQLVTAPTAFAFVVFQVVGFQ